MRYIILSSFILLFSCTQEPYVVKSKEDMRRFGMNMECDLSAKFEDEWLYMRVACSDFDDVSILSTNYWKQAIGQNYIIYLYFYDKDGFERYVHPISVKSGEFQHVIATGDVRFQGSVKPSTFTENKFKNVTYLALGSRVMDTT